MQKTGSSLKITVAAIWREKKVDPCSLETKKCSFQEKDYDIYLKAEKVVHSNEEHDKKCFPAILKCKKLVPSYFEPENHCCSYLEREKSGFLLFAVQKMQFSTVRSKEKDYDIYLNAKNWFEPENHCCSYLEREKSGSLLFGDQKMQFSGKRL